MTAGFNVGEKNSWRAVYNIGGSDIENQFNEIYSESAIWPGAKSIVKVALIGMICLSYLLIGGKDMQATYTGLSLCVEQQTQLIGPKNIHFLPKSSVNFQKK